MIFDRGQDYRHVVWAKAVKERDNYTCQICLAKGVKLNSHHIRSFDLYVDDRYVISNGICLCENCHSMFHDLYLKGKNHENQFNEFKILARSILAAKIQENVLGGVVKEVIAEIEGNEKQVESAVVEVVSLLERVKDGYLES